MKKQHMRANQSHKRPPGGENRRGTVLVVVMGLLGLLMLLGFAFYTFARQEQGNAEYFNAAQHVTSSGVSRDIYFNWAMEQIINGGPVDLPNSALWGGRHALMTTAFGQDVHPFSGSGINVTVDNSGVMIVDQDFDGVDDGSVALLEFNDSPAAQAGAYVADGSAMAGDLIGRYEDFDAGTADIPLTTYWDHANSRMTFPMPDVPYSYPDINNVAIGFNGYGLDATNLPAKVIIPSYHRPQYLRSGGSAVNDWATSTTNWQKRVMRPQAQHMHIAPDGTVLGERYPQTGVTFANGPFPLGDPEGYQGYWDGPVGRWKDNFTYQPGDMIFPSAGYTPATMPHDENFPKMDNLVYVAQASGDSGSSEPIWENYQTIGDTVTDGNVTWEAREFVKYDADPDGDGVKEAVYLDLDFPVQVKTDGSGTKYIPMFAVTIYDADGLLNLIAQGNINRFPAFRADNSGDGEVDVFGDQGPTFDNTISINELLHTSNLGATATEINPMWGLLGPEPTNATELAKLDQHAHFFGRDFSAIPPTTGEIANMEWFMSRVGKLVYGDRDTDVIDEYAGVYGEDQYLLNAAGTSPRRNNLGAGAFPKPGVTGADDNYNQFLGEYNPFTNPLQAAGSYNRYYVYSQPLDFLGTGSANNGRQTRTFSTTSGRWQQFDSYPTPLGYVGWDANVFNTSLMQNEIKPPSANPLIDEAFEVNVDHDSANPMDDILPLSDNLFLQMSKEDIQNYSINSRVGELMSYNLRDVGTNGEIAEQIRKRFTTLGWDMKSFGINSDRTLTSNSAERSEEFKPDFYGDLEFPPYFVTATDPTNWPTNYNKAEPFRLALRQSLKVLPTNHNGSAFPKNLDPVATESRQQRSLNLNGVTCFGELNNQLVGYSRGLTPHPSNPGDAVVVPVERGTNPGWRPPLSSLSTNASRERWARYDRQLLARDIYVLLYTFCGGQDIDYVATPNTVLGDLTNQVDLDGDGTVDDYEIKSRRQLYNDDQLHEMAQFAINVVERLDPDNVIEKFEYDKDLSDGWNLDDDPYDVTDGAYQYDDQGTETFLASGAFQDSHPTADRGVVYGVETQELTLAEGLAFRTEYVDTNMDNMGDQDLVATRHDENHRYYFTYLELLNAAPYSVSLNRDWQVQMETIDASSVVTDTRTLTLLANPGSTSSPVTGGGSFLIMSSGTTTGTDLADSRFMADLDYDDSMMPMPNMRVLAPAGTGFPQIDLITNPGKYDLDGAVSDQFLDDLNAGTTVMPQVRFTLRRRLHPGRNVPTTVDPNDGADDYNRDNPWIDVDVLTLNPNGEGVGDLRLTENDKNGWEIKARLLKDKIESRERTQRLDRNAVERYAGIPNPAGAFDEMDVDLDHDGMAETYSDDMDFDSYKTANYQLFRLNTLGRDNQNSNYTLWQPHGDRDFYSVSELLQVPLYGPEDLTAKLDESNGFGNGVNTAGVAKFVRPLIPGGRGSDGFPGFAGMDDDGDSETDEEDERNAGVDGDIPVKFDNRWYRLLEFFERPSVISREGEIREPGLMNLNGIRYPASLAGLIDDSSAFSTMTPIRDGVPYTDYGSPIRYMPDSQEFSTTGRDWWSEFLQSRDGLDLVSAGAITDNLAAILPGSPSAKPFRPLTFTSDGLDSLDHTVLRELPLDVANGVSVSNRRRLFELRDSSNADANQQYRLFSKLLNNSTTRTNAFFVFVQVDFFEVVETDVTVGSETYTLQQVGGKLSDSPAYRDFYVVDRSKAFGELRPANFDLRFEDYDPSMHDLPPTFAFWGNRNGNNPQGFNYRKLIVHREIIE
ncbi:hypothetical protein [Thalassoroseus pseudoceratinae]|uniref:hypothetical protein n=1 Tax=Thalassoroseus pseudoceratinae TaxID=2713176 RepID=UPI00142474D8|nr:hypothetical protein [Thalassoroseus pseudoceratinae]